MKKKSATQWKSRLDKKFSKIITSLGYCQRCGKSNNQLHTSHIYPKGTYTLLRYDPVNVLCLCAYCHRWFWHENPLDAFEWFKETFPERHLYLQEAKKVFFKKTDDWYQEVDKKMDTRDLKGLMVYHPLDNPYDS